MTEEKAQRIAKVMAHAGVASRREAERMIEAGRVSLDGQPVTTPATLVTSNQIISVDGNPIEEPEKPRLWRYNKPTGLITTHKDPEGRSTVFDSLPNGLPRVISVGRLDLNSEGLLLLTNNGELAHHLEHPSTGWRRQYKVRVFGPVDENQLFSLRNGIEIDGVRYGSIEILVDKLTRTNSWLTVTLTEGKNREIRRVLGHLGLEVSRLIRTAYGPFQLGKLPKGELEEVTTKGIKGAIGPQFSKKIGL